MFQSIFKFGITYNKRKSTPLQDVADRLLLRQDQTAFWRGLVDRDNKDHQIQRLDQILDQRIFVRIFWLERGDFFFQFIDIHI